VKLISGTVAIILKIQKIKQETELIEAKYRARWTGIPGKPNNINCKTIHCITVTGETSQQGTNKDPM